MKVILLITSVLFNVAVSFAQKNTILHIAGINPPDVALAPLRYLASDELKGRGYDRPEINVAAQYISNKFKQFGVKPVAGANGYFQPFSLKILTPGTTGQVTIGSISFMPGQDALQQQARDVNLAAPLIYAGHATITELAAMDVKGKIILLDFGNADDKALNMANFRQIATLLPELEKRGAVALLERIVGNENILD